MNQFVSRGGIKLQAAIKNFKLEIKNSVVLDVGCSTGGFTDCLLQNGAKKVYALDTAYGELAWKLRNDPRVVVMERTNILRLESLPSVIPSATRNLSRMRDSNQLRDPSLVAQDDKEKVDLVTIDAGWTRLELILPVVKNFLKQNGKIIALLKPHYEAEPLTRFARYETDKRLLKKGVLPADEAEKVKDHVINRIHEQGFTIKDQMDSPILGGAGNKEYLLFMKL